jgi:hypothetical protein
MKGLRQKAVIIMLSIVKSTPFFPIRQQTRFAAFLPVFVQGTEKVGLIEECGATYSAAIVGVAHRFALLLARAG